MSKKYYTVARYTLTNEKTGKVIAATTLKALSSYERENGIVRFFPWSFSFMPTPKGKPGLFGVFCDVSV